MKKLLIVNLHYKTGGIKKTLQDLVKEIKDKYEVSVMFFNEPTDISGLEGVKIIPAPFLLNSYISSCSELKKKNKYVLRLLVKAFFTLMAKIFGYERVIHLLCDLSKKLTADVAISYTHDIWWDNGNFSGGTNYYVSKKVNAKKKIAWIHGEPHTIGLTEKRAIETYKNYDYIVNVSKSCKKEFDGMFPYPDKSIYIRNLFDVDTIRKKALESVELNKVTTTFVTVSRLSSSAKRVDKVNDIAIRLKAAGKTFNWYVVGGGPEYDSYVSKSIAVGVDDCVHYVGQQDNPYKYINQSDMMVVTSDSEAYSCVIIEALICGKPVLTTNFNASYEIIENGVTGIISEKDVESIYTSMLSVLNDQLLLQTMTENVGNNAITNGESLKTIANLFED